MTQTEIKEIYRKQRKAFSDKKRYYKRKYGIELKTPKLVKNPTEKTLERFARNVYQQTEKAKKQAKKKKTEKKIPTRGEILLERIRNVIQEGLDSNYAFGVYKADISDKLIKENLPTAKKERIKTLQTWEKALPKLDKAIDDFIHDSNQSDTPAHNKSTAVWNYIVSIVTGKKPTFEEVYTDE